jgi:hypothetical protein
LAPKATRDAIFRQTIKSLHRIYEKASTFIAGKKGFTKQYTIALLHHILIPSLAILVIRKEAHVQNFPAYEISISINIRIQKSYEHKQAWSNL